VRDTLAVAALALAAVSCSTAPPHPHATAPPAPSPSASADAKARLAAIAAAAARTSYSATYVATTSQPRSRTTWRVWRTPTSLRVDVIRGRGSAALIETPQATFACRRAGRARTCFRVAKAGAPIPRPFQLAVEQLFRGFATTLGGQLADYSVATTTVSGPVAGGSCFSLAPLGAAPRPRIPAGDYCVTDAGVITAIRYSTGSSVRLQSATVATPKAGVFVPYASPTPI
jgi:hypothetical protein